jgi:TPP-dependent pyruvate/acetoin dehydrogenase alpha subunit
MHAGVVPMISLLGESLSVGCGVALTMKRFQRSTVVLASCGDGATNTGQFHEALNFASVQKLPIVFLIENNGYAFSTPSYKQFALKDLSERARAYAMPGESIDGNDVLAVTEALGRAVNYARAGRGPILIECKTFRVRGHSEADKADYVPAELRAEWLKKDPINRFEEYLKKKRILTVAAKAEIEAKVKAVVSDAVEFAEQSPAPDPASVAEFVFAPDGPIAIVGTPSSDDERFVNALDRRTGQPFTAMNRTSLTLPQEAGRR